ncbi:MAG: signal recognition particle protein [Spirochaetaceae bacterium]|nr:signal recognition particle protein [Spirochaetaceae bacterium]
MLEKITGAFSNVFRALSGKSVITEKNIQDAVEEIKTALLDADVNLRVVRRFVNATIEEARGEKVLRSVDPGQQFVKIIYDRIVSLLGDGRAALNLKGPDTQTVILMLGLQGSGKTTTAAKLALKLTAEKRRPLLAACDLVRPAAVEQLRVLGEKIAVPVYCEDGAKDAVRVAKNALTHARANGFDTLIVDTAGRLQIDEAMMKEIVDIRAAVSPGEVILVADSTTGQNAAEVARAFDEAVGLTGVILTKFDSDARGGAALSLKSVTGKPILFAGTGEKLEDLEPFHPDRIAGRILGMGDIVSLVEKTQETIDVEEAQKLQAKMASSTFTLQDMLEQLQRVKKMGSLKQLMEMVPGMAGQLGDRELDTGNMKSQEAIILSMTKKERANYLIIGPSRRKRIARGSGTTVADVNHFLKQFEKTRLMMKKMSRTKGGQARFMQQMGLGG